MCGIAGCYGVELPRDERLETVSGMTEVLAHRGPDDSAVWASELHDVALGHRRLSILDLSPLGRQPMLSACGRYRIAYNGEVYNHIALRNELQALGHVFRGSSDTETILAAFSLWGVKASINRFVGMFSMVVWDESALCVHLIRDRLGIKPLYYGAVGQGFVFASELKGLQTCPGFTSEIDRRALSLYFRHAYIPAPYSIFGNAWKVRPGEMVTLSSQGVQKFRWYDVGAVWFKGGEPLEGTPDDVADALESLLQEAVGMRMLSDVPLGAFLSGGVDSSLVVALMQAQSSTKVRTFSIGFREAGYDEAEYAKAVAAHLGTDHTNLYVGAQDMLDVLPELPRWWDEPFADSSQIPTLILSRLTRAHVTVALSGDGGDELFGGYDRYFIAQRIWRLLEALPLGVRKSILSIAEKVPENAFSLLGDFGRKASWRLGLIGSESLQQCYRLLLSHMDRPETIVVGGSEPDTVFSGMGKSGDSLSWMQGLDIQTYLPDDILTKVDRATMAASLEARVPLLDHRVVEFAATLPPSLRVNSGGGKAPLRNVLGRHIPKALLDRPKMGFAVPMAAWLSGPLREWMLDMLQGETLRRQGLLEPAEVERLVQGFMKGRKQHVYRLWDILMFQSWLNALG